MYVSVPRIYKCGTSDYLQQDLQVWNRGEPCGTCYYTHNYVYLANAGSVRRNQKKEKELQRVCSKQGEHGVGEESIWPDAPLPPIGRPGRPR